MSYKEKIIITSALQHITFNYKDKYFKLFFYVNISKLVFNIMRSILNGIKVLCFLFCFWFYYSFKQLNLYKFSNIFLIIIFF